MMNKWMTRLAAFTTAAAAALALTACGAQKKEIDPAAVADSLLNSVAFASELEKASDTTASLMFDLPEGTQIDLYMGNGAYSDELAIITCADGKDVATAEQAVEQHLSSLKASFEDYIPEEADKVDGAVSKTIGSTIILCVSGDENAAAAVDAAIK